MAEVMACGTPVLKLRRGVVPDVVKHGVTSYICDIIDERVEHVEHFTSRVSSLLHYAISIWQVSRLGSLT